MMGRISNLDYFILLTIPYKFYIHVLTRLLKSSGPFIKLLTIVNFDTLVLREWTLFPLTCHQYFLAEEGKFKNVWIIVCCVRQMA